MFTVQAKGALRRLLGLAQRREQDGRQDGNDGDDDQKFNQRESVGAP
jgi:hypothetical protein